jgi:hypothetical protein
LSNDTWKLKFSNSLSSFSNVEKGALDSVYENKTREFEKVSNEVDILGVSILLELLN